VSSEQSPNITGNRRGSVARSFSHHFVNFYSGNITVSQPIDQQFDPEEICQEKTTRKNNQEKMLLVVRNYKQLSVIGMKVSTKLSTPCGANNIADKNDQIKRGNKKNDIIHLYNNKLNISDALQIIRERMGVHMQRKKEKRKS